MDHSKIIDTSETYHPSSYDEEEEASEFKTESAENSEVDSARSTEDGDDGDDDDDESDGDDEDSEGDDAGEATGDEEKASSPHLLAEGPAMVPSLETSPRAPPMVREGSGPVGMEVDDDAFVITPRRREQPRRQSPALEPSFATNAMPARPHGCSAGSVGMPKLLGHKRPRE